MQECQQPIYKEYEADTFSKIADQGFIFKTQS